MVKRMVLLLVILVTSLNGYANDNLEKNLFGWNLEYDKFSIEMTDDGSFLKLIFLQEQGTLEFQILDDKGKCIYKEFINASIGTEYIIPIDNLQPGNYRMILINNAGGDVEKSVELLIN